MRESGESRFIYSSAEGGVSSRTSCILWGVIEQELRGGERGGKQGVRSEIISLSPDSASESCKHSRVVKPQT